MTDKATDGVMKDWRDEDCFDDISEPRPYTLVMNDTFVDVAFKDGRMVRVEIEGPEVKVHAYAPDYDEPLSLAISEQDVRFSAGR